MTAPPPTRWEALDLLRGLSVIGMLLNLNPGQWDQEYAWLEHVKWEGGHLIDMVAPAFLFCVGAVIPLSLGRRLRAGQGRGALVVHILGRGAALVALGVLFNAFPAFDWAHTRFPGVLQRIGLSFALVSLLVLFTARRGADGEVRFPLPLIAGAALFVLISYWALLYFAPVPGFGAPRFDPVGSWPAYIDRSVFGVDHMFKYWPVNGKVVFDPDGLIAFFPTSFNVLVGVLAGLIHARGGLGRPIVTAIVVGAAMMILALAPGGLCPIVKNIWTSTFALFSSGFALALLGLLMVATDRLKLGGATLPLRVFGANPLLAYALTNLIAPVLDLGWIPGGKYPDSIRHAALTASERVLSPPNASFLFSLVYLAFLGLMLWICHQRRWILKL